MPGFQAPCDAATAGIRDGWVREALQAHNAVRARHGSPPLHWNQECYLFARQQADVCQAKGGLSHGSVDGPTGRHGQNIFFCSRSPSPTQAVDAWASEAACYSYDRPGFHSSTGHFTQLVWASTLFVGLASSADGRFIVANYFPAGNTNTREDFERNVLSARLDRARTAAAWPAHWHTPPCLTPGPQQQPLSPATRQRGAHDGAQPQLRRVKTAPVLAARLAAARPVAEPHSAPNMATRPAARSAAVQREDDPSTFGEVLCALVLPALCCSRTRFGARANRHQAWSHSLP